MRSWGPHLAAGPEPHRRVCALLQEEAQSKAAGLEAEIQAERRAQRELKLVLAAAEKQAQQDSNERREAAFRCSAPSSPSSLHTQAMPHLHGSAKAQPGHSYPGHMVKAAVQRGAWYQALFQGAPCSIGRGVSAL